MNQDTEAAQAESVLEGDVLPTDVSESSKKYLVMSDPPLSLGGSERNQHL